MMKTFAPPLSGPVLGDLIEAFDLRRLDHRGVLTKRNARRYLAGERVSPEAETEVRVALVEAIVEAGLLPPGLSSVDLIEAGEDHQLAAAIRKLPVPLIVGFLVDNLVHHWDALSGALRRLSAPVAFPEQAAGACLRLVAIDAAVRLMALLWLSRTTEDEPLSDFWMRERGTGTWLRSLHEACSPPLSRDELAVRLRVHAHTLDGWLDADVRPTDENLMDLAHCFAERGLGPCERILQRLRLAFGARALFRKVETTVGAEQAVGICERLVIYTNQMLRFPRKSKQPRAENDTKMRMALMFGTLGRGDTAMPWVESMLNHLWRYEQDPVWRTSIKAATRSWFEHLQAVTAKLGSSDEEEFLAAVGAVPAREELEALAYMVQASKTEMARDPLFAAVMAHEAQEGGRFGALELKIQAGEAAGRGDPLAAIDMLRAATARDPLNAELHFRLGCNLWQIGDVAAGLTELEIAVQLAPTWDRARVEIAIVLLNEQRDEEALRRLLESKAALDTPSAWLLIHLAYAYERTSDRAAAITTYEELLRIEPENAEALDRLAHLYFVARDRRKGADAAKRAAQLGIPTVFHAWQAAYYDKGSPVARRPPHAGLDAYLQFPDSAWPLAGLGR
jgi:tetratricopeptide (TPR) repeat protein